MITTIDVTVPCCWFADDCVAAGVDEVVGELNLALFVDCAATKEEELTMKAYKVFLSKYVLSLKQKETEHLIFL
jgi:hypothetical protein